MKKCELHNFPEISNVDHDSGLQKGFDGQNVQASARIHAYKDAHSDAVRATRHSAQPCSAQIHARFSKSKWSIPRTTHGVIKTSAKGFSMFVLAAVPLKSVVCNFVCMLIPICV